MNQGATEFLLALGLSNRMVGTAYLDDEIWPQYADAFKSIPILSDAYPNETTIMKANPDFLVASYNSAFREKVFTNATVGPCTGAGSEWGEDIKNTCRPQLHQAGIGTYVFADHCEDPSLRPATVTEDIVYDELRAMGTIFNVDAEPIIKGMKEDFDKASELIRGNRNVVAALESKPLTVVWLDCVGRCCKDEEEETGEKHHFVGGGTGAPHLLMKEAGLTNVFEDLAGGWVCVKETDIIAADPDAIVVVDASWDTAKDKVALLYDHPEWCKLNALTRGSLVKIPFSATTLGPRNGPAARDLAVHSVQVRLGLLGVGIDAEFGHSGVDHFDPNSLVADTKNLRCPVSLDSIPYGKPPTAPPTSSSNTPSAASASPAGAAAAPAALPALFFLAAAVVLIHP